MHAFNSVASIGSVNLQENSLSTVQPNSDSVKKKTSSNFFNFIW